MVLTNPSTLTLTKRVDEISKVASKSETIINKFQKIEALRKEEENIKGDISSKETGIISVKSLLSGIENQLSNTEAKIREYQSKGTWGRFFSGLNLEKITRQKSSLLIQKDKETQKISVYIQTVTNAKAKFQRFIRERQELEIELQGENQDRHKKIVEQANGELKNFKVRNLF